MQIPQPGGFIDNPYAGEDSVEEQAEPEHQHSASCAHAPKKVKQPNDRPKFQYNSVVLPLICLSAFVVLLLTGKIVITISFLGGVISTIFDILKLHQPARLAVIVTMMSVWIAMFVAGFSIFLGQFNLFGFFLFLFVAFFFGLSTGSWACLQLVSILRAGKSLVLEKILFGSLMFSSSILTWAAFHISGHDNVAYWHLVFMSIAYYCVGIPVAPSISEPTGPEKICGRGINGLQTVSLVLQPALLYLWINFEEFNFFHLSNVGILLSAPLLVLGLLRDYHPLWWADLSKHKEKQYYRYLIYISIGILIGCLEYRLIFFQKEFHFSQFIALSAPWSYLFVTVSLYAVYGAAILHVNIGKVKKAGQYGKMLSYQLAMVGACASSYVLGLSWYLYFAPIFGAQALMSFYWDRAFWKWVVFVVSVAIGLQNIMSHHYGFLDYEFDYYFISISFPQFRILLLLFFTLQMLLPGALITKDKQTNKNPSTGILLGIQSVMLVFIEYILLSQREQMYPAYLAIFTTTLGVYTLQNLLKENQIHPLSVCLIEAIYISKLSLLVPGISPFEYCFSLVAVLSLNKTINPAYTPEQMTPIEGSYHFVAYAFGALQSTRMLLDIKHLIGINEHYNSYLQNLLLTMIVFSVGILPLTQYHFKQITPIRQMNRFLVVLTISLMGIDMLIPFASLG